MTEMNSAAPHQHDPATGWTQAPVPQESKVTAPQPSIRDALVDLVKSYRRPALLADPGGAVVAKSTNAERLGTQEQELAAWPHFKLEVRTEDGVYTLMIPELAENDTEVAPRNIQLPPRLAKIARLVISGCTDKQIATQTELSFSTVRTYVRQIYRRLNVHSRVELVHATSMGLTIE